MAANLKSAPGLANLGKQLVDQIRPAAIPQLSLRMHILEAIYHFFLEAFLCKGVHVSSYDKNPEENANPTIVPDHVMPQEPNEYWSPHPKTGVFGPAKDDNPGSGQGEEAGGSDDSVLEQKTFFRPMEDLDKPQAQP